MTKLTEAPCLARRPQSLLRQPKYRAREERRRLLKLCHRKLRSIEDPEQILRRAVLINNTLRHLQYIGGEEERRGEELRGELVSPCGPAEAEAPAPSPCSSIEDILSEISLPPPLDPQLEDLTNFRGEERRSHLACSQTAPLTSSYSSPCYSPPHLLSSSSLPSYDAVVPSSPSLSSSSFCSSFPPFEASCENFSDLYKQEKVQEKEEVQEEQEGRLLGLPQCSQDCTLILPHTTLHTGLLCRM